MAKGRKLTTSRSERFLGSYNYGHSQVTTNTATDLSEFDEDEIWLAVEEGGDRIFDDSVEDFQPYTTTTTVESAWNTSHRTNRRQVDGLSLAIVDSPPASPRILHQFRDGGGVLMRSGGQPRHMATSAPVNVPDWSKILRVESVGSMHDSDDGYDERESEIVPPHEYLAREYEHRRKMGGASVIEGVGRTLKGRDLRRVRDAIWSQTGVDG